MKTKRFSTNRREFLKQAGAGLAALGVPAATRAARPAKRPNIVWIDAEDMSRNFSYNGETTIRTPHVDRLAAEGAVFTNAYITCPVCSPSRSAMITGMYQTTIGAHQHRSSRGEEKIHLPEHVKTIPDYFREAGYYVSNCGGSNWKRAGKTDYNFVFENDQMYDAPDWSGRKPGQPFFAQIQLHGGKNRGAKVENPVDPADVKLPPYYPDDPVVRDDWAKYLNSVLYADKQVGEIMQHLRDEKVDDNTVVIFLTDHGISHARGKQFLYDEGARIPFIVRAPGRVKAGVVREDPIAHIDMAATSMDFAGIAIPEYMESRPLFGPRARPRDYVVSARDRCDETVERIRSVRKGSWKYIRNFYPKRPHLQPCAYKDAKEIMKRLRELNDQGKLNDLQKRVLFAPRRRREELYDLRSDPWEIKNLAKESEHEETLLEMRGILRKWIKETGDKGQDPELDAMYDSDMKVYVDGIRGKRGEWGKQQAATIEANIRLMKKWAAEGR